MPVIEHPVHEHGVRIASAHRYGCWNRPDQFKPLTIAQDGWNPDGSRRTVTFDHRMSHDCRYDRSLSDNACAGCRHAGGGERYVAAQEQAIARG